MPLAQVSLATFFTSKPAKENARPQAEDSDEDAFITKPPPSSTLQKPSAEPPAASAPHPRGASPSGATKSTERAAADMAVRTKPPPGWTKVMDFGKLKGYRSRDGRKAMSLPAAWRLYDDEQ